MRVRLFRVKAIPGLHWRVVNVESPNWFIRIRSRIFPAVSHETVCLEYLRKLDSPLTIQHPSDISPDDIQIISDDFTHDYRIRFMGYSSICTACIWSFLVMPNGGWFALLFKDVALPIFASYSGVRAADMFCVMKGAEKISISIQQANCEFIKDIMLRLGLSRLSFRVRVSGLPYGTSSTDLMKTFEQYGPTEVVAVRSERGKDLGQSFVSFSSVESAIQAKDELNGKFFNARRMTVACDFRGPRVVEEVHLPREPHPRRLIKQVRDKAVGAKWPTDPVMANTNESRMIRRYKTGGLPRSHDRQR